MRRIDQKRICIVTETYPPEINGVALTLARLASGLRALGHLVSIVRPRQPTDGRGDDARGRDGELTLIRGFALPRYKEVRVGLPAGAQLRECWGERRPDAVYVATEGPLGWSAVRTANQLDVPVWSGFHTNFADYARHYGLGWLAPVVLHYLRSLHNRTRGTLVASAEMRDRLRGLGFNDVSVLGRGVDSELFSPGRRSATLRAAWGVRDEDTVGLYVGRLAPEKNVPLAVEAYRAMRRARGTGAARDRRRRAAARRARARTHRPDLLRDAHGRAACRALRLGRRLPLSERDGDVRKRHARGDGERAGRPRIRLRRRPHPRRAWRVRGPGAPGRLAGLHRGARRSSLVSRRVWPKWAGARGRTQPPSIGEAS